MISWAENADAISAVKRGNHASKPSVQFKKIDEVQEPSLFKEKILKWMQQRGKMQGLVVEQ